MFWFHNTDVIKTSTSGFSAWGKNYTGTRPGQGASQIHSSPLVSRGVEAMWWEICCWMRVELCHSFHHGLNQEARASRLMAQTPRHLRGGNNLPSSCSRIPMIYCCSSSAWWCLRGVWPIMAPNGIICYFQEDTVKWDTAWAHLDVMCKLLLMLALLVTPPVKTTTSRGAGQELMELWKLGITFIAGRIYRPWTPPSLCKGRLQRIFLSVLARPKNSRQRRLWQEEQNIRIIPSYQFPAPCYHAA